jgi:hypothetical protein
MEQNRQRCEQAKIGLSAADVSKVDNLIDGIGPELFSDLSVFNYFTSKFNEKKAANSPDIEMKSRIDARLHDLKQEGRGMVIRRANSEERDRPVNNPPALHVAPAPSSIGTMISGLLGSSGNP